MSPEGIQLPNQILPSSSGLDLAAMGAFASKVEQNVPVKKPESNAESSPEKNDPKEEGQNTATGYFNPAEEKKLKDYEATRKLEYTFKFNSTTQLVDLIQLKTGKVIQSIKPIDMVKLLEDLRYASGVFVDNSI